MRHHDNNFLTPEKYYRISDYCYILIFITVTTGVVMIHQQKGSLCHVIFMLSYLVEYVPLPTEITRKC